MKPNVNSLSKDKRRTTVKVVKQKGMSQQHRTSESVNQNNEFKKIEESVTVKQTKSEPAKFKKVSQ